MAARGGGSIVTSARSTRGSRPTPGLYEHIRLDPPFLKPPAYGMSKAGVTALTRYLAALWGTAACG